MLLLAGVSAPLAAQFKSFPVYAVAAARPGWVLALDFGSGLNAASGQAHHLGARVAGALGPVGVTAGVGAWDAPSNVSVQLGGTAAIRVAGPTAGPLTVFAVAGAGRVRAGPSDTSAMYLTFPVGLALIRRWGGTGARAITPWVFPRGQVDRVTFAGAQADQLGIGFSAGVSADLTGRVGVHGALEWLHQFRWTGPALTLQGGERATMGVGAYLRFSSPP